MTVSAPGDDDVAQLAGLAGAEVGGRVGLLAALERRRRAPASRRSRRARRARQGVLGVVDAVPSVQTPGEHDPLEAELAVLDLGDVLELGRQIVARRPGAAPAPAAAADDGVRRGGEREVRSGRRTLADLALVLVGVGLLVLGARWLVTSATSIGAALGISDLVIGLTVIAVGTSLPELATSVIAAVRGQRDLAVGNIVGSNIFNIGAVLGLTGVISPAGIPLEPGAIALDLPVMIVVAVALLPVAFTGAAVARWEGLVFLAYYAAYVAYLVLDSTGHDALDTFSGVVVGFLLPMTALTLAVLVVAEVRRRRASRGRPQAGAGPGEGGTLST
jgi:K+-dependent Na+/Ca+ exchanger-like protein